jgi:hypothetical protein
VPCRQHLLSPRWDVELTRYRQSVYRSKRETWTLPCLLRGRTRIAGPLSLLCSTTR